VAFAKPSANHLRGFWTERRATQFAAFPEAADVGARAQPNVLAVQPHQLGNSQTRLHRHQDKGSIATPDPGRTIRNREQRIHLLPVEELDRFSNEAFVGNCQDALAMQDMRGIF
jgi:hypothetical protein